MPKIDFTDMPYEKEYSTGEHVRRNAFYLPDETIEESDEIYRGYYTIHYPVLAELLTEMNKMSSDEKELLDKKPKQTNKFRDEVMEVFERHNVKDELALHVGLKLLRGERRMRENKNE